MHPLDWLIALVPITLIVAVGIYTRRYMRSVADFISGGRLAGPYLLAVSRGELEAGAVVFVALFEIIAHSGFTLSWWGTVTGPVGIVIAISGFVVYRYRETRAMTLAQFFELRYSKRFRVFTGMLGFIAGLVNFGIIPAVGSRFLVYFLGLPPQVQIFSHSLPTYILLMAGFLSITLFITLNGGLITVMVTNCLEGIFSQLAYLIVIAALLFTFSWSEISQTLSNRPPGQSLLNPFDSMGLSDFNLWYILMSLFVTIYGTMAWQNSSAYNAAAISPHASVMGGLLGRWREFGKTSVITLLAICAVTFMQHPDFAAASAPAHASIAQINDPQIQKQMEVPIAVTYMLPLAIKGLFCAVLLMGVFGGDSTHLHSWGSIFVQDVLVPLRKKPFTPEQHIRILRRSIIGVAIFAFFFGSLFQQTEYVIMWFSVTMAIYVGGAGAAIIGGLYWKLGTTAAAWTALLCGSGLSVGGIVARQIYGNTFPLNGTEISFVATLIAIVAYVLVSLLTTREAFNMDRLLHRGAYASVKAVVDPQAVPSLIPGNSSTWGRIIGFDEGFSVRDKWIAGGLFGWSVLWFVVFLIGTAWNLIAPWPETVWSRYWQIVGIGVPVFISFVTGIWFTWGGTRDIFGLFRNLKAQSINNLDDGTVVDHQNMDELPIGKKVS